MAELRGTVAPDALAARVLAAAQRAVDAETALGHGAGPALPIVARALTGDPTRLPWPAPRQDDDEKLSGEAVDAHPAERYPVVGLPLSVRFAVRSV